MTWGQKIVWGMALFMLFIIGLGAKMIFSAPDDLVENDYYEKGQAYNADYNAQRNAIIQGKLPRIYVAPEGIVIIFKENCPYDLDLLHPFDASKDIFEGGVAQRDVPVIIARSRLAPGTWTVDLRWNDRKEEQRVRQQVVIR